MPRILAQAGVGGNPVGMEPTVKSAPAELQIKSATATVSSVYHSHAEAEAEAKKLQAQGRKTVVRHAGMHPDCWSVYSSKLPTDD